MNNFLKKSNLSLPRYFKKSAVYYLLIFLLCLMIGLIDGYRSHITSFDKGQFGVDLDIAIWWDVSGWLIWVALVPFVFYLCRTYPINLKNWHHRLLFFIPLGLLFSLVRTLFPFLIDIVSSQSFDTLEWLSNYYFYLFTDYLVAFVFYSLVLTFGQAVNYYKQYREEELRVLQLESQLSKAQIQALKMQLHPHFLFNALNSISAMQHKDFEIAQEMTVRLGDFLRLTLENVGVQEITLEQEIRFLKCYLDIERVRFENGLDTNIKIAPEVRFCKIPNLILQPLVENAIKHGIVPLKRRGKINIRAEKVDHWLKVEITDNGRGLENQNGSNGSSNGIGLTNTKARLQKIYSKDFRFQMQDSIAGGLSVTLFLPYKISKNSAILEK